MHSLIPVVPSLEDNAVIAECTYNVLVDALIRMSTIPDEDMKPRIAGPGSKTMFHSGLVVYAHCSLKILSDCDNSHSHSLGVREAAGHCPNHAIFNNHPADPNKGKEFWRGSPQG